MCDIDEQDSTYFDMLLFYILGFDEGFTVE